MQELARQIGRAWVSLGLKQQASLVISALMTVAAVGGIVWWASQPTWGVLYTGLDARQSQEVLQELQSRRVPHRLQNGGTTIEAPAEQISRLRMELATLNVSASNHPTFQEIFENSSIAQSSMVQRVQFQRALEGELSRTIESLDEVSSARVHLVLPGDRVFLDDDDVATASVTLALAGGRTLNSEQVQAVAQVVARAVPELNPQNVSVVDTQGRVLWDGGGDGSGIAGVRQIERQAAVEREINGKVARVLEPIVGPENYVVRTTAELDFQRVVRQETQLDPDSGVLISEQKTKEKSTIGTGAGGVAGTASNLPSAVGGALSPSAESMESSTKSNNFEYSKVTQSIEQPTGSIRRLSIAVLVDHTRQEGEAGGEGEPGEAVPRSEADLQRIEQLVKAAISFDEDRGDRVIVEQAPFIEQPKLAPVTGSDPLSWLPIVKYPALVVLLLLAFLLFYRPLVRTVRDALEGSRAVARAGEAMGSATAELEPTLQIGPPSRLEVMRQRLSQLAQEQPEGLAQTLRVWLHEDKEA